jgi:hypothetical protein
MNNDCCTCVFLPRCKPLCEHGPVALNETFLFSWFTGFPWLRLLYWHAHSVHTKSPSCCHRYVAVTTRTVRFLSETDAQLQQTILSKLSAFLVGRLDFGGSDSVARGVYLDQLFRAARYGARADLS